jgi:hypothetical protein
VTRQSLGTAHLTKAAIKVAFKIDINDVIRAAESIETKVNIIHSHLILAGYFNVNVLRQHQKRSKDLDQKL